MKYPVISLLSLSLAGFAAAGVPKKGILQTYSVLWNNSPFTAKPPQAELIPDKNPLEDFVLIGVSPIGTGDEYRVTMINKKEPDKREMVFSNAKDAAFQIIKVTRKAGDPLGTVVTLKSGNQIGTVSYDEKLLTLAAPVAAKTPVPQPGQPPVPGLVQPVPQPGLQRMPRPRVVPPPTPVNGQQPQASPQVQPQNNSQRPERRRN